MTQFPVLRKGPRDRFRNMTGARQHDADQLLLDAREQACARAAPVAGAERGHRAARGAERPPDGHDRLRAEAVRGEVVDPARHDPDGHAPARLHVQRHQRDAGLKNNITFT